MDTVKVSSKGQIVIPKAIRESRNITTGTEFVIRAVGDELRLTPAPAVRRPRSRTRRVSCIGLGENTWARNKPGGPWEN